MNFNLFAFLMLALLLAVWIYVQRRKHPPYDGSVVILDMPDFQPTITPERDGRGKFVKGHAPLAPRGQGGRFVKAA